MIPRGCAPLVLLALLIAASGLLGGCGLTERRAGRGEPTVAAAFYPLEFVARRVAGSHARVFDLTTPGAEPHDLELTIRQRVAVTGATYGLYEQDLQPTVDAAMRTDPPAHVLDVADVVPLSRAAAGVEDAGGADPHFWQDPVLLARVANAFATTMEKADPAHAEDYRANNQHLQSDLARLDHAYREGLATCRTRTLVVSHDAFEYLGRRYHLDVHPIAGLSPDSEPTARHLQELAGLIRSDHVTTVFNERLASPKFARSLAGDLGIGTAVLDPIEGLTSADPDASYLTLMRANLRAIQKAGDCT